MADSLHHKFSDSSPNFSALVSQAHYEPTAPAGGLNPLMSTSMFGGSSDIGPWLNLTNYTMSHWGMVDERGNYVFTDDHVVLYNGTGLKYPIPKNTTLVEVLGPSGHNPKWVGKSLCFASLDPQPEWWQSPNVPNSISGKPTNAVDQPMFLLPIDPEIKYELWVSGPEDNDNSCPITGVRTYPFH